MLPYHILSLQKHGLVVIGLCVCKLRENRDSFTVYTTVPTVGQNGAAMLSLK